MYKLCWYPYILDQFRLIPPPDYLTTFFAIIFIVAADHLGFAVEIVSPPGPERNLRSDITIR